MILAKFEIEKRFGLGEQCVVLVFRARYLHERPVTIFQRDSFANATSCSKCM